MVTATKLTTAVVRKRPDRSSSLSSLWDHPCVVTSQIFLLPADAATLERGTVAEHEAEAVVPRAEEPANFLIADSARGSQQMFVT